MDTKDFQENVDNATAARLARLAAMPIDVQRLQTALRSQLPAPRARRHVLQPIGAAAGILLLVVLTGWFLLSPGSQPAFASVEQMAQVHEDLVSGRIESVQASSIEDANRILAAASSKAPLLPQVPTEHVMACCMRNIRQKQVACVLLKDAGVPVTLAVSDASGLCAPDTPVIHRENGDYYVTRVGRLSMVMVRHQNQWVCLMAELETERLIQFVATLRF